MSILSLDVHQLLEFCWCSDTHIYRRNYERNRVQISLILSLTRPNGQGLVLSSRGYYQSTKLESLLYKNINIRLVQMPDGTGPEFQATITLTNLKGRREADRIATTMTLQENRRAPLTCPVLYLLALSLQDGAFAHVKTPEDLSQLKIPENQSCLPVPWDTASLNKAILRNFYDAAWKYSHAVVLLNNLRQRAALVGPHASATVFTSTKTDQLKAAEGQINSTITPVFKYPSRIHLAQSILNPTAQVHQRYGDLKQLGQLFKLLQESKYTEEKVRLSELEAEEQNKILKLKHNLDRFQRVLTQERYGERHGAEEENSRELGLILPSLSDSEPEVSSNIGYDDGYSKDGNDFYHSKWSFLKYNKPSSDFDHTKMEVIWCEQDFHCRWEGFCPFVLFGPDVPGGDVDFRTVLEEHIAEHINSSRATRCKWKECTRTCSTEASLVLHAKKKHIPLDERPYRIPLTDSAALIQRRFRLDDRCLNRLQYITNTVQEEQGRTSKFCPGSRYKVTEGALARFLQLLAQEDDPPFKELGSIRRKALARWALARTDIVRTPS